MHLITRSGAGRRKCVSSALRLALTLLSYTSLRPVCERHAAETEAAKWNVGVIREMGNGVARVE